MYELVGKFCMEFRKYILRMTLKEIAGDYSISNVSSFEHGKANKIDYLFLYYNACKNDSMKDEFIKGVFESGGQISK